MALHKSGPHKHKITNSYGVYDFYKFYRRTKPREKKYILTESQYFAIIRKINTALAELFVRGKEITFPMRMGDIELRKAIMTPRIGPDGKVIFRTMIDWDKTLKLWYEDEESYKNKTLVKYESKEIFKTFYNKAKATYTNKSYYGFQLNKDLKRELSKNIKRGLIDAFLNYQYGKEHKHKSNT
jgi:hypothetical protein